MEFDLEAETLVRESGGPFHLRVLIVYDGRVRPRGDETQFGLGAALRAIGGDWLPNVRVDITIARHDQSIYGAAVDMIDTELLRLFDHRPVTYLGSAFRFDDGVDLDTFDVIWLFADNPGDKGDAESVDAACQWPLTPSECIALSGWMNRGGGVFATGDHAYIGASLCSPIPRVRSMRRWTSNVPMMGGPSQNDTLQPGEESEHDLVPQPVWFPPGPDGDRVHPVLTTVAGVVDHLPDHVHEGQVEADDDIDVGAVILGSPEFPEWTPVFGAAGAGMPFAPPTVNPTQRPRPHVIAWGAVTADQRRFPLIGVYNGDLAKVGRIIVDSTWHHWFTYNLAAYEAAGNDTFRRFVGYYRNCLLWLVPRRRRPQLVASMLAGAVAERAVWLTSPALAPAAFRRTATGLLAAWVSQPMLADLVGRVGVGRAGFGRAGVDDQVDDQMADTEDALDAVLQATIKLLLSGAG